VGVGAAGRAVSCGSWLSGSGWESRDKWAEGIGMGDARHCKMLEKFWMHRRIQWLVRGEMSESGVGYSVGTHLKRDTSGGRCHSAKEHLTVAETLYDVQL
jgi:hypothetical protein